MLVTSLTPPFSLTLVSASFISFQLQNILFTSALIKNSEIMASGGKLLPMMALSIAGATLLVRHSEQKYYPGLFLWTTLKVFSGIIGLFLTYSVFIYPFFLSPIRHIPGPSVSRSLNSLLGISKSLCRAGISFGVLSLSCSSNPVAILSTSGWKLFPTMASSASAAF